MSVLHHLKSSLPVLTLAGALLLAGCTDKPQSLPAAQADPIAVTTARPVVRENDAREYSGSVVSIRDITVASRLGAYVTSIRKREGATVAKGEVLVELDDSDVKAVLLQARSDVNAAQLRLADAQTDLKHFEALLKEEASSDYEVRKVRLVRDQSREALRAAQARLEQAQQRAADAVIRAPEDARVVEVRQEPGSLAVPGLPILKLQSLEALLFEVQVPVSALDRIRPGQQAVVTIDGRDGTIAGRVERVVHAADRTTRTGAVKIALPQGTDCLPGEFGRAALAGAGTGRQGIHVAKAHLAERGGLTGVFVIENNKALFQWLRLGRSSADGSVEVLAGLKGNETLVAGPAAALYDGSPVTVAGATADAAGAP